jgi:uncharacterized membrane protein YfcA
VKPVLIGVGIGVAAGVTSGLLGVGGGIVIVPLLVAFAALTQHQATATSLAAIVPIATVAATRFALGGRVDWALAALLAAGSLLGAPLGARIMSRSSPGALRAMFGVLMIAVSLQLLLT